MGRKSVKSDKSEYQKKREELELTREAASELMDTISPERLFRLEDNPSMIQPEDVLELSRGYRAPELCTYYCRHDCAIGAENSRDVTLKELPEIAIETLGALSRIEKIKGRLAEIAADGEITEDEYRDFTEIETTLEKIALSVDNLKLWIKNTKAKGDMKNY